MATLLCYASPMVGALQLGPVLVDPDQRVQLQGSSWMQLEILLAMRGDRARPRIAYLDGVLELMSPSRSHEMIKTNLARLLESYALELGLQLEGFGSWTLKESREEAGAEPDECYIVGDAEGRERPDLAIEVVWTSGGLDKLEIYRRLGVREVWWWEDEKLRVYALQADRYVEIPTSELLPQIDLSLLMKYATDIKQTAAIRALLAEVRKA
jgi:Uma2 family endonuclease